MISLVITTPCGNVRRRRGMLDTHCPVDNIWPNAFFTEKLNGGGGGGRTLAAGNATGSQ